MNKTVFLFLAGLSLTINCLKAQSIVYSEPEREDARSQNFEIIGKMGGKILIHKNNRDVHQLAIYGLDMKLQEKVKFGFIADRTHLLSTDFILYPDFICFLYQYQQKATVYAMAVKLDLNGKPLGAPVELDTTNNVTYDLQNKIYTFINSEDKQKIAVFKISTKNDKEHVVVSSVFDKEFNLLEKVRVPVSMPERNDFLSEFGIGNDGAIVCLRQSGTSQNDNINKISLLVKPFGSIDYKASDLKISKIYLDDTRIKIDNLNKHYIIASFFSRMRRGNVDGLYYALWDMKEDKELINTTTVFSDEFRDDAKGDAALKTAFNDYYLKNIILRKDGGFMVVAEAAYVSNRGNILNRWDYMSGSPFFNPLYGSGLLNRPYSYYSLNNGMGLYPWGGYSPYGGMYNNLSGNANRYNADNIAVLSFEPKGKMEWSNVIRKAQYDDNTDNYIGFGLINSGDQLHFLFNMQDKKTNMLTDQTITPVGQINRNPTIKNLDRGYDFMPRHVKQIGSRQAIVPCMYRGYTCFAKIDF